MAERESDLRLESPECESPLKEHAGVWGGNLLPLHCRVTSCQNVTTAAFSFSLFFLDATPNLHITYLMYWLSKTPTRSSPRIRGNTIHARNKIISTWSCLPLGQQRGACHEMPMFLNNLRSRAERNNESQAYTPRVRPTRCRSRTGRPKHGIKLYARVKNPHTRKP